MVKYNGYYIDGVIFHNKQEIDNFIKDAIIDKIKVFNNMLLSGRYNAAEMHHICEDIHTRETVLHDTYGMAWEDIEMIPFN